MTKIHAEVSLCLKIYNILFSRSRFICYMSFLNLSRSSEITQ